MFDRVSKQFRSIYDCQSCLNVGLLLGQFEQIHNAAGLFNQWNVIIVNPRTLGSEYGPSWIINIVRLFRVGSIVVEWAQRDTRKLEIVTPGHICWIEQPTTT